MTIEQLKAEHPELYIKVLIEGAYYGVHGFTNLDTLELVEEADKQIKALYDSMHDDEIEHQSELAIANEPDVNQEHFGCPHCGSYEGDPTECPECGHGQ